MKKLEDTKEEIDRRRRSKEQMAEICPWVDLQYETHLASYAEVETKSEVLERGKRLAAYLSDMALKEKRGAAILVVTHASPLISLVRGFIGDDALRVRTGVCSLTKLVYDYRSKCWRLAVNGDCAHLSGGEVRNYAFSDEV